MKSILNIKNIVIAAVMLFTINACEKEDFLIFTATTNGTINFQNELQIDNSENLTFQPNFGVGFKYKGIEIDYAFTDIGDQSAALYSNVFSVKLDFSIFR